MNTPTFDYQRHQIAQVNRLLLSSVDSFESHQFQDAAAPLELCIDALQNIEDQETLITFYGMYGSALALSNETEKSVESFKKRAYLVRQTGDKMRMSESLECVGLALAAAGFMKEAEKLCPFSVESKKVALRMIFQKQLWADFNPVDQLFPNIDDMSENHNVSSDEFQIHRPPSNNAKNRRSKSPNLSEIPLVLPSVSSSSSKSMSTRTWSAPRPKIPQDKLAINFTQLWVDTLERVGNLRVDHILDPPSSLVVNHVLKQYTRKATSEFQNKSRFRCEKEPNFAKAYSVLTQSAKKAHESGGNLHDNEELVWKMRRLRQAEAYFHKGKRLYESKLHQKALQCFHRGALDASVVGSKPIECDFHSWLGLSYQSIGWHEKAIEHHTLDLRMTEELAETRNEYKACCNLGHALCKSKQFEKGLDSFQRCLMMSLELGDRNYEAASNANIGHVYECLGDIHKATEYFQEYRKLAKELDSSPRGNAAASP